MLGSGTGFARFTPFERLLSLVASVRPGEGRAVALLLAQVFLLLHAYYLLRPLRDSLILSEGNPEIRAYATGAIAVTLIFLIPLYRLLFHRIDGNGAKSAMLRWVATFFITNLLIFAFLAWTGVPIAVPFFVWLGIFSVMVVAQFWGFAADLLNIKTGQRLFATIMVGAAIGALTGAQLSGRLVQLIGIPSILVVSAALLGAVVLLGRHAEASVPPGSRAAAPPDRADGDGIGAILGGFQVVARSRYLVLIAAFVMLLNWVHSTGGYILSVFASRFAADAYAAGGAPVVVTLSLFYGDLNSWVAAVQLVLQLFVVSRLFQWFGVRGAIIVLPLVMLANYGLIAVVPVFALVRVLMIAEMATNYSIHGTTNHALYLPVSREEKYVGKTTIDTFFWRFGDLVYAGMIFVTAQLLGLEVTSIILVNLGLALLLLLLGVAIGRHHHSEIRRHLDNLPPVVSTPLPDVYAPAGQMLVFTIPDNAFMDPDPGDALRYAAMRADGRPLPRWMRFDRVNQTLTVCPPREAQGRVDVEIVATDFEGLSVRAQFAIDYGPDPVPRFVSD